MADASTTPTRRRPIVGGNWKMNTTGRSGVDLAMAVADRLHADVAATVDVVVYPPSCYLLPVGRALAERGSRVLLGAQNVWYEAEGAYTGELSCGMLADCGAASVILGHSERRHIVGESDELVGQKLTSVLAAGMHAILCVGETLEEREAGTTDAVNERQLRAALKGLNKAQVLDGERGSPSQVGGGGTGKSIGGVTIAYEPVWAIGTGRTASPDDAQNAHERIRAVIAEMFDRETADRVAIQYGGSVKPGNAAELFAMPDIDGGLIGGASLNAEDFAAIVEAAGATNAR